MSPAEQLRFVARLMRYELPAKRANIDKVKAAFRMPPGKITNASGTHDFDVGATLVHAKTGNATVNGERVSWLIGHLVRDKREFVFVARVRQQGSLPGTAGLELARRRLVGAPGDR